MSLGPEPTRAAVDTAPGVADRLVDEVLGEDVDWRSLVRRYPMTSLGVAVGAGFYLARRHGTAVIEALGDLASRRVSQTLERLSDLIP